MIRRSITTKIHASLLLQRNPACIEPQDAFAAAYHKYLQEVEALSARATLQIGTEDGVIATGGKQEKKEIERAQKKSSATKKDKGQDMQSGKASTQKAATVISLPQSISSMAAEDYLSSIRTESDAANNTKALDRYLERVLYLLVRRRGSKAWEFPSLPFEVEGEETKPDSLHEVCPLPSYIEFSIAN